MKLATRISSIRRIAWNTCRSCSADSDSMCADSLARPADAGWMRSPRGLEHAGHRVLGQPVDLEVGVEPRSSSAIATSRHACPSPIGEEM